MLTLRRRLMPNLTLVLATIVSIIAWMPLVLASQTPAVAATTPVPDQRVEIQIGTDIAGDGQSGPMQQSAPHFKPLCDSDVGLWAQTITAGMTARLSEVELLLLRRAPDIDAPVRVEIRAVDAAGRPTETVLGQGVTQATVPVHRAEPGWLMVPLNAPVQLLRGQKVAIFPTSSSSASGACYEWVSSGLDTYAGGLLAVSLDRGATFSLENGTDAAFRTWTR